MFVPIIRTFTSLCEAELTQQDMVLDPWLPVRGIAMIAGPRGGGKTMLGLGCALAIAGGGPLLGWEAPMPRRVLYLDGEMALAEMQERVLALSVTVGVDKKALARNLMFYCDADQKDGIPDLALYSKSRDAIEQVMHSRDIEVLFIDNLSAVCNSSDENDTISWVEMQSWLRKLRRKGYTVIFLHHTGKEDAKGHFKQRGTSKREDIISASLLLKPEAKGFGVIFTKHRGFSPQQGLHVEMKFEPGCYELVERDAAVKQALNMTAIEKELWVANG